MTESEWLAATDSEAMQTEARSRRLNARVFRLFACACCRRVWHLLLDERGRAAVEAAEAFAEARIKRDAMAIAEREAEVVYYELQHEMRKLNTATGGDDSTRSDPAQKLSAVEAACVVSMPGPEMVAQTSRLVGAAVAGAWRDPRDADELLAHARLLRDVGDNLFFGVKRDKLWMNADVRALLAAAYQHWTMLSGELEPTRLSILADALEDAGCDATPLLEHLRSPGPHIRGCWALEVLRGRR